jgi:choline dehydrogenase-like flavoprotein
MIIDLLRIDEDLHVESADVCVVGGGTAGLPLSEALVRHSLKVVVLEYGSTKGNASIQDRPPWSTPAESESPEGWIKAIGGTSRIWGGRLIGLNADELQPRPCVGLPGWPMDLAELDAHTGTVERLFKIPPNTFAKSADWVYDAFTRPLAAESAVLPKFPVIVDRHQRDVSRLLRSGKAQPTIYANASVCDFSLDRAAAKLVSVEAKSIKGNRIKVFAAHFVFAGGAIETTRLLLWLNRRGDSRIYLPAQNLGRNLQDHINYPSGLVGHYRPRLLSALLGLRSHQGARRTVHFTLSPAMQRARSLPNAYLNFQISHRDLRKVERIRSAAIASGQSGIGKAVAAFAKSPKDVAFAATLAAWYLSKTSGYRPTGVDIVAQIAMEQLPSWSNAISLSDKLDRHGVPLADVAWEPSNADENNARTAQSIFETFWTQSGLSRGCPVQWQQPRTRSGEGRVASLFHPCGSIAMGTDRATTIVGPDLACHAVPNLSVLSTAVLPSAGSGNPTMPLLQLAYRLANTIVEKTNRGCAAVSA